jgi:hypothetical protein
MEQEVLKNKNPGIVSGVFRFNRLIDFCYFALSREIVFVG